MARNGDESNTVFMSDVLDCDVNGVHPVDDAMLQTEIARLNAEVSENNQNFACKNCGVSFSHAKSLRRHERENRCAKAKPRLICQNCGKSYQKQAFLLTHTERGKCIRPRTEATRAASSH